MKNNDFNMIHNNSQTNDNHSFTHFHDHNKLNIILLFLIIYETRRRYIDAQRHKSRKSMYVHMTK